MKNITGALALRSGVSAVACLVAVGGFVSIAQPARADALADAAASLATDAVGMTDIVVSGSRIVRDGYDAPTPTTVFSADELTSSARINIADVINQLPALGASPNPSTQVGQISAGGTGINSLNLRNLGAARTLVLFDGKRVPAAALSGLVDVNFVPDALVERVEVVTGGASAAWGSDAVAGVVNFVLDKDFTGVKGSAEGGITTFGDNESYKASLSLGTPFAGGRGHVMVSGQLSYNAGLKGYPRSWYSGAKIMNNPAYAPDNGQPFYLVHEGTGFSTVAPGAIVTTGPMRGLYFGANGTPAQLNFGPIVSDPYMVGGDWQYTDFGNGPQDLEPMLSRQSIYGRVSYEITDNVQVYAEAMYARAHTSMHSTPEFQFGNITIQRDNAFLPQEVVSRMDELGLDSLRVGTWKADYGGILTETTREQERYVVGATGDADIFGTNWNWNVYANRNKSHIFNSAFPTITSHFNAAIDAVRDANGAIVCRSTLTNPNNGCVPYNMLGTGVASDAAINYVRGNTWVRADLTQDTFAGSMNGEPFSTWAGPVSIAFGIEHRREKIDSVTDPLSVTSGYWAGNYKALEGSYNVTEAFLETVVPLVEDKLDVNLAIRGTDYSSSGYVTTWKAGFNFAPIEDVRFRFTRSRDIRAGNLSELYASGQTGTATISDPFRNNAPTNFFEITSGNPDLKPEKADTIAAGVVFQPSFLPGLAGSVDYFDIKVKDAVASLGFGTILNECFRGDTLLCSQIDRDADGVITHIRRAPLNFQKQMSRGLDFELSYRFPLFEGELLLRGLATHYMKAELDNGLGAPNSSIGELRGGLPDWKYRLQATYRQGPVIFTVVGRGVTDGVYDRTYIACTTNCPTSTAENRTINTNHIDGAFYLDLSTSVELAEGVKASFAVDNVTNRSPSVAARGTGVGSGPIDSYGYYFDMIGRRVRAGLQFQF